VVSTLVAAAGADPVATRIISASLAGGDALKRHLDTIAQQLGTGAGVRVGFLADATYPAQIAADIKARVKPGGVNGAARQAKAAASGLPVAQVAFWNEFGTSRTPARPFIRNMIASKSPRWGNVMGLNLRATGYNAQQTLGIMGELIKDQMVTSIRDFRDPGNAAQTIARKGFDKPLIDTGVMQRSVDYQVVDGPDDGDQ